VLPPQVAVADAAPLGVLGKQRCERLRIAVVECFGRCAKLVDHDPEYRTRLAGIVLPVDRPLSNALVKKQIAIRLADIGPGRGV
jgi:hypothetical protein